MFLHETLAAFISARGIVLLELPYLAKYLFVDHPRHPRPHLPHCGAIKPAVDKSVERVQTKLASMLNRLELEISEVEKRIGDKMVRITCELRDVAYLTFGWLQQREGRERVARMAYRDGRWKRATLLRNSSENV